MRQASGIPPPKVRIVRRFTTRCSTVYESSRQALRRIKAFEILQAFVLGWWGIALSNVPGNQRGTPFFSRMTDIMPYQAWIAVPCVLAVALIVSSAVAWRRGTVIALIGTAVHWGLYTWLIWSISQTYLTPGLTAAFVAAALWRQFELQVKP